MGAHLEMKKLKELIKQQYRVGNTVNCIINCYKPQMISNFITDHYSFVVDLITSEPINMEKYHINNSSKYDGDNTTEDECGTPTFETIEEVTDFTENCKLSFSERLLITQLYLR